MNIVILNGSPRPHGNTAAMVAAYREGAEAAGHYVSVFDVCRMKIAGCLACEYCHTKAPRQCVQRDDMQKIYPMLDAADMIVLASPVYYHSLSGQLQCAIHRIYAPGYPRRLKKAALLLSSESKGVYDGAIYIYRNSFLGWLHLEDMGIFTAAGDENRSPELLERLRAAGSALRNPDECNVARLVVRSGDVELRACLNQTQAARDLMNRLPLTLVARDSSGAYCCELKEGVVDKDEMRDGWAGGDVSLGDGGLVFHHGEQGCLSAQRLSVVAHMDEEDRALMQALPSEASFELSLEEPWR